MAAPPSRGDSPNDDPTADSSDSTQEPTDATTPELPSSHNASSPDDKCVICLELVENKASPDGCHHHFCFSCLVEWAKVKDSCPLCMQRFGSIIHNVRSQEDHDRYFIREQQSSSILSLIGSARTLSIPVEIISQLQLGRILRQEYEGQSRLPHATFPNALRGPHTSVERLHQYISDLWAVPNIPNSRHVSPEFYCANPRQVDHLVHWLNRDLNALMDHNETRVSDASNNVLSLILNLDNRHPDFSRRVQPLLNAYTEPFVQEFYSFASPVFETINEYDRSTIYAARHYAFAAANPVDCFRLVLRDSRRASAPIASTAPAAVTHDTPQPGPSVHAAPTVPAVTSSTGNGSNSHSSNCVVMTVRNPLRDRTPTMTISSQVTSYVRATRVADRVTQVAQSDDCRPLDHRATNDPSSSDESAE